MSINFVPEDYVQSNESRRTNLMYLVLFVIVMAALGGVFMTIKMRQHVILAKEKTINAKMKEAETAIARFEDMQKTRQKMMETAKLTMELLEPVPRSVLLASLTNNLPAGASLLDLKVVQKESKMPSRTNTNKFEAAKAKKNAGESEQSKEKSLETDITIEGIAPSDLQVASYIEELSGSILFGNVALVESKEHKIDDTTFREFKLTTKIRRNVQLSKEDVKAIRDRYQSRM